jgi:hypothetical protein
LKQGKVSFNTFVQGREYRGLDKMNINGEHNDPTIMRAKISWDIFEKMGVKAPRANHIRYPFHYIAFFLSFLIWIYLEICQCEINSHTI